MEKYGVQKTLGALWHIPPNIGDSGADIPSFVGEAVNVMTAVVTQLRAMSDFDVRAYGPRAEGMLDHLLKGR